MKKTIQRTVRVEGQGNTKDHAFSIALGNIQKKVMSEHKGMIIRIEPINVEVVEARERTYTERFLIFFLPRKRQTYKVVLDIDVQLFILDVDEISFEKADDRNGVRSLVLGDQSIK